MNETTKKNDSRGRLVRSMLVLLLCLIMFVASTWAWFTDTASNTGNKITAGNLKVALLQRKSDGTFDYEDISNEEASIFTTGDNANETNATLWEPGATHIAYLAVQNKGSLALQYNIYLDVTDNGLASALEYAIIPQGRQYDPNLGCTGTIDSWTDAKTQATAASATNYGSLAAGSQRYTVAQNGCLNAIADSKTNETEYFAVAIHMKEDAGNDYQSKDITIDVHVAATQKAAEQDSYTTEYDSNAVLPVIPKVVDKTTSQEVDTAGQEVTITDSSGTGTGTSVIPAASTTSNIQIVATNDPSKASFAMAAASKVERNFKTTATTADSVTYDISYNYIEGDKTYQVSEFAGVVINTFTIETGLKNVVVTHTHDSETTTMTQAASAASVGDGQYYYTSTTGELKIASKKYSNFKISYDTDYAASIGTKGYATIEKAIEDAGTDDTVVLQKDLSFTQPCYVAKTVTLDLAGHTITPSGNFTGSADKDALFVVKRGGTLTVNDSTGVGKISTGGLSSVYAAVKMIEKADSDSGSSNNACLVINSGTLEGTYYAITGNGSRNGTDITINGGTITATAENDNLGIFHPQNGKLTINGGTITGYSSAIEMRAGTLNISGGTFTATAETFSCNSNGSGNTTVGAAIAIAQHTTKQAIAVNISGGTFTGNHAFNEADPEGNNPSNITASITGGTFNGEIAAADVTGFIAGGTFNRNPISYLKTGYRALKSQDEDLWTVSQIPTDNYTVVDNTIQIANVAQFVKFAQDANAKTLPSGVNQAELTADVDLDGISWTPINIAHFTFNGKNFAISNLYANETSSSSGKVAGLFGEFSCSTMQNLTVNGATVQSTHYAAVLGAHGLCAKFENCTVNNAVVTSTVEKLSNGNYDNGDKAGAICGYLSGEPNASVTNCTVSNCTIEGYRDVGSVVGIANGTSEVSDNTATNVTVINNRQYHYKTDYTNDTDFDVNRIVGETGANATVEDNTATNAKKIVILQTSATVETTKQNLISALNNAESGDTIVLPETAEAMVLSMEGNSLHTNGVTVQGSNSITIRISTPGSAPSVQADGAIFDSVKFDYGNQTYNAIRGNLTFKNCTFSGLVNNYDTSTFTNCTFTNTSNCYQAHIYGGEATFTGCTFDGSNRNVYVYTETGDAKATFEKCTFNMTETDKSCVMLNANNGDGVYTVVITNCTASEHANNQGTTSRDGSQYDYKGIYGIKNLNGSGYNKDVKGTVTLDGTKVFEQ